MTAPKARPRRSKGTAASRVWPASTLGDYNGPLLLDTHVWIWYLEGDTDALSPACRALLERCGSFGELVVCDISYWEVAVKVAKGRLSLSVDAAVWLQRAELAPDVRLRPLTRPVLLESTRLGGAVHGDPADRMLIAFARLEGIPLVTADRAIIDYAIADRATPVIDARH